MATGAVSELLVTTITPAAILTPIKITKLVRVSVEVSPLQGLRNSLAYCVSSPDFDVNTGSGTAVPFDAKSDLSTVGIVVLHATCAEIARCAIPTANAVVSLSTASPSDLD